MSILVIGAAGFIGSHLVNFKPLRYVLGQIDAVDIFGIYDTIDLTAERDYIHVDDLCSACVNVVPKLSVRGEILWET